MDNYHLMFAYVAVALVDRRSLRLVAKTEIAYDRYKQGVRYILSHVLAHPHKVSGGGRVKVGPAYAIEVCGVCFWRRGP
jgi:hypothetical protein